MATSQSIDVETCSCMSVDAENHRNETVRFTGREWLNDCHIHATQQLIQLDPYLQHTRGLQDPILGQFLCFDVMHEEMMQILCPGGNHWVTVNTIGSTCTSPTVWVYDVLGQVH